MSRELNLVTSLHTATKRDYLGRMNDSKVEAMMNIFQSLICLIYIRFFGFKFILLFN